MTQGFFEIKLSEHSLSLANKGISRLGCSTMASCTATHKIIFGSIWARFCEKPGFHQQKMLGFVNDGLATKSNIGATLQLCTPFRAPAANAHIRSC